MGSLYPPATRGGGDTCGFSLLSEGTPLQYTTLYVAREPKRALEPPVLPNYTTTPLWSGWVHKGGEGALIAGTGGFEPPIAGSLLGCSHHHASDGLPSVIERIGGQRLILARLRALPNFYTKGFKLICLNSTEIKTGYGLSPYATQESGRG